MSNLCICELEIPGFHKPVVCAFDASFIQLTLMYPVFSRRAIDAALGRFLRHDWGSVPPAVIEANRKRILNDEPGMNAIYELPIIRQALGFTSTLLNGQKVIIVCCWCDKEKIFQQIKGPSPEFSLLSCAQ